MIQFEVMSSIIIISIQSQTTSVDAIDVINQSLQLGLNRDKIEKGRAEVSQLLGF